MRKPKAISLYDGSAECISENYDDMGGGAFCVQVDCPSLYEAKDVRRLIKFLTKAEKWLANKEKYKKPGPKPKVASMGIKPGEEIYFLSEN